MNDQPTPTLSEQGDRAIHQITDSVGTVRATVGSFLVGVRCRAGHKVSRIAQYRENGQCAPVPWFAVYVDNTIVLRLNAAHMSEVEYD